MPNQPEFASALLLSTSIDWWYLLLLFLVLEAGLLIFTTRQSKLLCLIISLTGNTIGFITALISGYIFVLAGPFYTFIMMFMTACVAEVFLTTKIFKLKAWSALFPLTIGNLLLFILLISLYA